jgi:excisionase family DNA binding protein
MEPLLLKAADVAKLLGLGRTKVFAMLAAGELPVVRIGRSVRVPRAALERWVVEHTLYASFGTEDANSATSGHTRPDDRLVAVVGSPRLESGHVRPHVGTSAQEPTSFAGSRWLGSKKGLAIPAMRVTMCDRLKSRTYR